MKLYVPITSRGEKIKLYQFLFFKVNWLWPLEKDCPRYQTVLVNAMILVCIINFALTVYAQIFFMAYNAGNIAKFTECMCTTFIGGQFLIRIVHLVFNRNLMREVLREFYKNIYVHKSESEKLHREVEKSLRVVYFISFTFPSVFCFIILDVAIKVARDPYSQSKPYLYLMNFHYDSQEPWNYALTTLYTGLVGFSSVTMIAGQDIFIASTLNNCAVRYKVLQTELDSLFETSWKNLAANPHQNERNGLHKIFRRQLRDIVRKQQVLDSFLPHLQSFVSATILFMISFGTLLLCVLAFQIKKTDLGFDSIKYFIWLTSQCLEFYVVGSFGQRCTDAAASMANSYYMCNWESLLPFGDVKANAQVIREISFAIYRSQKSVHLHGMNFVILSLSNIGSAMSTSVSYFMFLNTMEDITTKRNGNK